MLSGDKYCGLSGCDALEKNYRYPEPDVGVREWTLATTVGFVQKAENEGLLATEVWW
jgi:hypothetical protein